MGKLDFAKYMARSFLLPLAGLLGTLYLAHVTLPEQWERMVYPCGFMAGFAGIFNLTEAFKTWAGGKHGGK